MMLKEVGLTILDQLGGTDKLHAMVGTHCITLLDNGVRFKFKGSRIANCCEIILNGLDLYDVTFYRIRGTDCVTTSEEQDIYCDMLIDLFEENTGLYLTLFSREVTS